MDQSVCPGVPLADAQWARMEPLLPDRMPKRGGRWREHREVIDAIAYKFQTGQGVERRRGVGRRRRWRVGHRRTRIIEPKGATDPRPVGFCIHGAGWVFGDDKTHDRLFRELTVGAGAADVSSVYDWASEKGPTTQVEQNYAVAQWLQDNGVEHGLDISRVSVGGE